MKRIIVTGASSGIGRAVATRFLQAGWEVGLIARRAGRLDEIAAAEGRAMPLPCDVTDAAAVEAAFDRFCDGGRLDALFNNAGVAPPFALPDEVALEDWHGALAVNLTGMVLCARAAFGRMRRQTPQGGRIINNGSIAATAPRPGSLVYTTTKHGVTGLTKALALDGRPFGIACGQIDIGNARTDLVEDLIAQEQAAGRDVPPTMDVALVGEAVLRMAEMPAEANVLFQTLMATTMPLVGRG